MKRIIMRLHILLLICSNSIQIQAQEQFEGPQIIPPSPNAASLGQYADIPVSNYTGVPNISIPLYTIKSGDIQLPININYHASGIRVAQEASWVGLGWSLNAGGVITRQIRGLDDLAPRGYGVGYPEFLNQGLMPPANIYNLPQWPTNNSEFNKQISNYKNIQNGNYDGEPDIFYYNFLNYSGKLVYKSITASRIEFISLDQNNLTFTCDIFGRKWTAIDGNGWKYYFGGDNENAIEKTRNHTISGSAPLLSNDRYDNDLRGYSGTHTPYEMNNAWYITKIETPKGDTIDFTYGRSSYETRSQISDAMSKNRVVSYNEIENTYSGRVSANIPSIPSVYSKSQQTTKYVYLQEISFNNGFLKFNTEDRHDLFSKPSTYLSQRLASIELLNLEKNVIKKVAFNYSYFNNTSRNENYLRLKLNSIQEFDNLSSNSSIKPPPYEFDYYGSNLPRKTSYAIDHWGYYNGVNTNYTLIPYFFGQVGTQGAYLIVDGSNRGVDEEKMKTGSLKSIKYPTGTNVEFIYESNDYFNFNRTIDVYSNRNNWESYSVMDSPGFDPEQDSREEEFTIEERTPAILNIIAIDHLNNNFFRVDNPLHNIQARLIREDGRVVHAVHPEYDLTNNSKYDLTENVILEPGTYKIQANYKDFVDPIRLANYEIVLDIQVGIRYRKQEEPEKNIKGGGLRIKSIITKDGTSLINKKEFSYKTNGNSTGRLMSPLSYYYTLGLFNSQFSIPQGGVVFRLTSRTEHLFSSSNSVFPLGSSAQGGSIGYDQVTVYNKGSDSSLFSKSEYFYRNRAETPVETFLPGVPNLVNRSNGQLLNEKHYNNKGDIVRTKSTNYKLNRDSRFNIKGVIVKSLIPSSGLTSPDPTSPGPGPTPPVAVRFYDVNSEWWHPKDETERIYDVNGNNPITTFTTYDYDNPDHKNVTQTTQTNSDRKTLTKKYYYPSDRPTNTSMSNSVFNQMIADHVLNPVLKEETEVNDVLTHSIIRNHTIRPRNEDGQIVNMYLPENVQSLKNGTEDDYETRIDFKKYDSYGNLLEVSKTEGAITSYIWGYNREYPIAKIENATYQDIAEALYIPIARLQDYDESNLSQINTLRSRLPNAMVATYTYDPLIGVTSMTDPKGYTMTYHYDDLNRLKFVKDQDGNIVSENEYHYKNN